MKCPNCKAENPSNASNCSECGAELPNLYAAPNAQNVRPTPVPGQGDGGDDTVATIIPYKNPAALIAYYIGLFSCCPVPILGFTMGIISIVLAVKGFKAARLNPKAHGTAHAWIGIICGSIGVMIGIVSIAMMIMIIISANAKK